MQISIAIKQRIWIDYSNATNKIIRTCQNCNNTTYNDQEDADIFSSLFNDKFNVDNECAALVFDFIDEYVTHLFPKHVSASSKKNIILKRV